MKQQLSREDIEQRLTALRAERRMILERAARRNVELAVRLSELHVKHAARRLRGGK